jgi:glutamyl-tRNA synthetase
MSKRERDKLARATVKQQNIAESPLPNVPGLDQETFRGWLKDTAKQLETNALEALAAHLKLSLPEVSVDDFRRAGFPPEVITNFISLLGWSPPPEAGENVEKFDMAFLAKWFDLSRIGKSNARFDRKKLLAFNTDAIAALDDGKFACRWWAWCEDHAPGILKLGDARFTLLAAAIRQRSKTFLDAADQAAFVLTTDDAITFDPKAVDKNLKADNNAGLQVLRDLRAQLAALNDADFTTTNLHALVERYAADRSLNMGKVAQPLRVALTGSTISPPIDATLAVLGKQSVLARIDRCLKTHG